MDTGSKDSATGLVPARGHGTEFEQAALPRSRVKPATLSDGLWLPHHPWESVAYALESRYSASSASRTLWSGWARSAAPKSSASTPPAHAHTRLTGLHERFVAGASAPSGLPRPRAERSAPATNHCAQAPPACSRSGFPTSSEHAKVSRGASAPGSLRMQCQRLSTPTSTSSHQHHPHAGGRCRAGRFGTGQDGMAGPAYVLWTRFLRHNPAKFEPTATALSFRPATALPSTARCTSAATSCP